MARISSYTIDNSLNPEDKWIGTDGAQGPEKGKTKNFTVQGITGYIVDYIAQEGVGVNTGGYTFEDYEAFVGNEDPMILNATSGESSDVKAQLVLNPSDASATLLAKGNDNTYGYSTWAWNSASWITNGNGVIVTINEANEDLHNFIQNTLSQINWNKNNLRILINNIPGQFNGWNNSGYNYDIYIENIIIPEGLDLTDITFVFNYLSQVKMDFDESEFIVEAQSMDLYLKSDDDVYIQATGDDIHIQAGDDIRFIANRDNEDEKNWRMNGGNGQFEFPGDGYISNPIDSSGDPNTPYYDTMHLVPDSSIGSDQYIILDPTSPNHIHIRAGGAMDASNAELIIGGEQANVKVVDYGHNVSVNTYDVGTSTSYGWVFGNDGILYGPAEGAVQVYGIYSPQQLNIVSDGNLRISSNTGDINFYMDGAAYIGDSQSSGRILTQQDLNNVPVKTLPPDNSSSQGNVGQISWDTNYFYVCVATDTWKRSALSSW